MNNWIDQSVVEECFGVNIDPNEWCLLKKQIIIIECKLSTDNSICNVISTKVIKYYKIVTECKKVLLRR